MKISQLTIFALFVVACSTSDDHSGSHHLLKIIPSNIEELHFLHKLKDEVDFWNDVGSIGQPVYVRVEPEYEESFKRLLIRANIRFQVEKEGVQDKLSSFFKAHHTSRNYFNVRNYNFDQYMEFSEIEEWLVNTADRCTGNLRCSVESIGKSYENRDLWVIKMETSGSEKKKIWLDGGIHAREWIAPATNLFTIKSLIDGFLNNDADVLKIFEKFDVFAMPVVNPDGYVYSHTTSRTWRKNRTPNFGTSCVGTDLNRNFNHMWGQGCSTNPCSQTYCGSAPLSEPAAKSLADYIMNLGGGNTFSVFITMHSFSQLWMSPWGYTIELPDDHDDLIEAGNIAVNALAAVHGTTYTVGPASHILYTSSGTSRDWAYGIPKIKYVYTIELRDRGQYGFLLPPEQIRPTGEETWAGLKAMFLHILEKQTN